MTGLAEDGAGTLPSILWAVQLAIHNDPATATSAPIPASTRYGALAITYNVSASLFGGTTPLLVSWLINATDNRNMPAYYMIFAAVVGMIVVTYFVKDTSGKSLRGSPPAVEEKQEIKEVLEEPKSSPVTTAC